jgi:hypothetical protein
VKLAAVNSEGWLCDCLKRENAPEAMTFVVASRRFFPFAQAAGGLNCIN